MSAPQPQFTDPFSPHNTPVVGPLGTDSGFPGGDISSIVTHSTDDSRRCSDDSDQTLYDMSRPDDLPREACETDSGKPFMPSKKTFFSIDPDDPRIHMSVDELTQYLDDDVMKEDLERNQLMKMSGRQRVKEKNQLKIVKNVTSHIHRQRFLVKLAKALSQFGCPTHSLMGLLHDAAKILKVQASIITLPNTIIASFGDSEEMTAEIEMFNTSGGLDLGRLPVVRIVYYNVVHDVISAKDGIDHLNQLMSEEPIHSRLMKCIFAFMLSALLCAMSFGGSFVDLWIAGLGSALFCAVRVYLIPKVHQVYSSAFEVSIIIIISFSARALSTGIPSEVFCYNAISSAGIAAILPGFMILISSLELASKNMLCGSSKMIYVLAYVLLITFGLQVGSDLYLILDANAREKVASLSASYLDPVLYTGSFLSDAMKPDGTPVYTGTFEFRSPPIQPKDMLVGCHRPSDFPWFKQPFPWWSLFILVPLYTILSSTANQQPFFKKIRKQRQYMDENTGEMKTETIERWRLSGDLVVMVVIACVGYVCNRVAKMVIFDRSDVVAAIGAFVIGLLGNTYQRCFGGTAFTNMVTGVCFLVPSSFSQTGDNFSGNVIDIGSAMIKISVGISVGLLMSRFIVCVFGRKMRSGNITF